MGRETLAVSLLRCDGVSGRCDDVVTSKFVAPTFELRSKRQHEGITPSELHWVTKRAIKVEKRVGKRDAEMTLSVALFPAWCWVVRWNWDSLANFASMS